ncbi:hypothetical protein AcW1_002995 [Taiwanofungus camphoratus]|nr:hypothetical protein AcV7_005588 [Antrodia cinnamomea]KAI0942339.1 hypothetical protein AcW1_002995 [Antrodia cinnamomea]
MRAIDSDTVALSQPARCVVLLGCPNSKFPDSCHRPPSPVRPSYDAAVRGLATTSSMLAQCCREARREPVLCAATDWKHLRPHLVFQQQVADSSLRPSQAPLSCVSEPFSVYLEEYFFSVPTQITKKWRCSDFGRSSAAGSGERGGNAGSTLSASASGAQPRIVCSRKVRNPLRLAGLSAHGPGSFIDHLAVHV